jgi:hypothetical protein
VSFVWPKALELKTRQPNHPQSQISLALNFMSVCLRVEKLFFAGRDIVKLICSKDAPRVKPLAAAVASVGRAEPALWRDSGPALSRDMEILA